MTPPRVGGVIEAQRYRLTLSIDVAALLAAALLAATVLAALPALARPRLTALLLTGLLAATLLLAALAWARRVVLLLLARILIGIVGVRHSFSPELLTRLLTPSASTATPQQSCAAKR